MSFIKNMMDHDLALLQTLDGNYILYTSKQGDKRVIDGMIQMRSAFIPGGHVEMVSTETALHMRAIDSYEMQVGDKITVDSNIYEIAVIKPSNEGIVELILERL